MTKAAIAEPTTDSPAGLAKIARTISAPASALVSNFMKTWNATGRPYSQNEISALSGFSEFGSISLLLQAMSEAGDDEANEFVLLAAIHSGGEKVKTVCEAVLRSAGYRKYLETLTWLLAQFAPETPIGKHAPVEQRELIKARTLFAIELCDTTDITKFMDTTPLSEDVKKEVIAYSLPAQSFQYIRHSNTSHAESVHLAILRAVEEFGESRYLN